MLLNPKVALQSQDTHRPGGRMISAHLHNVCAAPGVVKNHRIPSTYLVPLQVPYGHLHTASPSPASFRSGSSTSSRIPLVCRAEPEPVSGYTPSKFITFSNDEHQQCRHNAQIMVDAPLELCYSLWSDWTKLLDFLDLVGQIGLDSSNPNMALFQCFYRLRKLPLMEIVFLLERQEQAVGDTKSIAFNSVYGMPIKGQVQLQEQEDGRTRVQLYFTHPVPNLLVQLQIGPFGVETDMMRILKENMEAFKQQVEAAAPSDWQQRKQEVAARAKQARKAEQQQQQQEIKQQQEALQESQAKQEDQQQQLEGASSELQQQKTPKRSQRRTSTSKASPAADAVSEGAPGSSRRKTRGRTASNTVSGSSASSSVRSTGQRRSKTRTDPTTDSSEQQLSSSSGSSNGNGNGSVPHSVMNPQDHSSGRRTTSRRSSRRTVTE